MTPPPIAYFNRYTQQLEHEAVYGESWLRWLYGSFIGKCCLETFVKRAFFSRWYAQKMHSPNSRSLIATFVKTYSIRMEDYEKSIDEYTSFNDFFCRKLTKNPAFLRKIDPDSRTIIFPADARHTAFQNISEKFPFVIKGQLFDLRALLQDDSLVEKFCNGTLICSRLCPTDYHRFHFPLSGIPGKPICIPGPLYSVNPIALSSRLKSLWENKRTLTLLETPTIGTVAIIEIGATFIGSIHQTFTPNSPIKKGDEKGFFSFGGSTLITLFQPNTLTLAPDLSPSRELYARFGDVMGRV
jgi:phosphatidylserine decarboxylase